MARWLCSADYGAWCRNHLARSRHAHAGIIQLLTDMTLSESIASIAESQIGVRETKANGGEKISEYQSATWLPVGPWAWCAAFCCYVIREAIKGRKVSFPRPQTAGAWDFERWCRGVDDTVKLRKPHKGDIKRGDLVIFTFSHIGIALGSPDSNGLVETCEGNTNGDGSREGDGVYRKRRHIDKIRSRIRFS